MANGEKGKEVAATDKGGAAQKAQPMRVMSPFEEMERMIESFFPRAWPRPSLWERPFMGELALPKVTKSKRHTIKLD